MTLIYSAKLQNNRPVLYTNHRYDTSNRITRQVWKVGTDTFEETYTYNEKDGTLSQMNLHGEALAFTYNKLKQLAKRTSPKMDVEYGYRTENGFSTNQVASVTYRKQGETTYCLPRLDYTYDAMGNISSVTPLNKTTVTYTYDGQNKLRKETKGTTVEGIYDIDTYGNIRSKQWKDANGVRNYTFTYSSGGAAWMDQIKTVTFDTGSGTAVTKTLTYDAVGNPLTYYNGNAEWTFTWQNGKQLDTAKKTGSSATITNTYDADGIRDSKTVGSVKHTYTTLSGRIVREAYGTTTIDYIYDNQGKPYKLIVNLNGTKTIGYFALNLQGDVIAIIDSNGQVAVNYEYDAWGREISNSYSAGNGSKLYTHNRLKYRGYYYDSDLGLYYLNSRFYDPAIGRFINADTIELVLASQCTLSDKNLYAYCDNNPVMRRDESGAAWETVFDVISLGASIADVAANPTNVWAWAGLAGDIADVAIPFIGGIGETIKCCGAVNKADNIIDVAKKGACNTKDMYRAVGVDEYYDIMSTKQFRGVEGTFAAKEFGNDFNETLDFANRSINRDKVAIIKVTIPEYVYNQLHHMNLDAPIFKSGTPVVEPEMLEYFNNNIVSIEHVF